MKISFIADTHHYSQTLGMSGQAYELRSGSDQKCLAETGPIIDAAFSQIAESDSDAVFILGDVTNDGEMVSHLEFREKLYTLQKEKPIYIITSTHDWCCDKNPRRFEGVNTYSDVEVMKSEDLADFYKDFGPRQASDSFITAIGTVCYTVELSKKVRVLCLNDDKNENDHAGYTKDCWEWIEKQIENAKNDGCLLIGIEHHLLMPHASRLLTKGSVCISDHELVASRFADAGLKYMLVGHSHMQATDSFTSPAGNTITEINVGSLCGYPAPIVDVVVNEDLTLTYTVNHLIEFSWEGQKVDAQKYLAKHACDIIGRILECRNESDFEKRCAALGIKLSHSNIIWPLLKPFIKKIDTASCKDAYLLLKHMGFARNISDAEADLYKDKLLKEMVFEVFLNLLDGQQKTYSRDSVYYKMVMAVFTIPSKLKKKNEDFKELISLADYILTGGSINNQHDTI